MTRDTSSQAESLGCLQTNHPDNETTKYKGLEASVARAECVRFNQFRQERRTDGEDPVGHMEDVGFYPE